MLDKSIETQYDALEISSITSDLFRVDFGYGTQRCDLCGEAAPLKSITLKSTVNGTPQYIKEFNFDYYYANESSIGISETTTCSVLNKEKYRLILESVTEKSGTLSLPPYEFEYYLDYKLPDRYSSTAIDHWGYYNGASNSDLIPSTQYTTIYGTYTYGSANRNPALSYARTGSLKKIIYPTGGTKQYNYALNRYYNGSANVSAGGLRIYQTIMDDGNGNITNTYYNFDIPGSSNSSGEVQFPILYNAGSVKWYSGGCNMVMLLSTNLYPLTTVRGSYVAYKYASVYNSATGKKVYKYHTPSEYSDVYEWYNTGEGFITTSTPPDDDEVGYKTLVVDNNWKSGSLAEEITYDSNGDKVSRAVYDYTYTEPGIPGYPGSNGYTICFAGVFNTNEFKFYRNRVGHKMLLDNIITYTYEQGDETNYIKNTTDYYYDSQKHFMPTRVKTDNGSGGKTVVKTKYMGDYSNSATDCGGNNTASYFKSKNMLALPVEQQVWEKGLSGASYYLVGGTIKTYCESAVNLNPHKEYALETGTPLQSGTIWEDEDDYSGNFSSFVPSFTYYKEKLEYTGYDNHNNLVEIQPIDGEPSATIWGYGGTLPVARVTNAHYSQVYTDVFEDSNIPPWTIVNSNGTGTNISVSNDKLRLINYASASSGECDRVYYNKGSEITGSVVFEFDVTIANSNNWDLTIAMGGNGWTTGNGGIENAVWTAINNETWYFYSGGWTTIKTGLVVGKTYHFKIVANCSINKADFYVDGKKCYSGGAFRYGSSGIQKIAFGNYGYGSVTTTWYVDNVRLYPTGSNIVTYTYDPGVGVTSATNNRGRSTYTEYDGLGRVVVKKDHDGNVIEKYNYHFAQ